MFSVEGLAVSTTLRESVLSRIQSNGRLQQEHAELATHSQPQCKLVPGVYCQIRLLCPFLDVANKDMSSAMSDNDTVTLGHGNKLRPKIKSRKGK